MKRADGSTMTVDIGKFAQADQTHIASWLQKQHKPSQHSFSVQFTKEKMGSSKMSSDTFEKWKCLLAITNRSGMTLENLTVDYEITVDEYPEFEADTPTKVRGVFRGNQHVRSEGHPGHTFALAHQDHQHESLPTKKSLL